jgi:drug/metabolite transporter (DMT)-like permease
MTSPIGYALISLVFAGLTDVAFKRYARIERSRGLYVAGMGAVWAVLQLGVITLSGQKLATDVTTMAFGVVAGLFVSLANLLLIESMTHIPISLASTVYRLNTIGVVLMAVILLAEPLTEIKVLGVALGIAAILLLYERGQSSSHSRLMLSFLGLAILASFLRACFGITTKFAAILHVDLPSLLLYNTFMWVIAGSIYAFWREGRLRLTMAKVRYSLLSGVLICGVANFLALALQQGEASIVVPVANMSFVVAMALSVFWKLEVLTSRKIFAVGLTAVAIFTLAKA